jgi:hypothetical protein
VSHPRFRFFVLNTIFRHRAMRQGRFVFLPPRGVVHDHMTVGEFKTAFETNDGLALASKIIRCVRSVWRTRLYWPMEGAKLRDMISQIGTSTFFHTLSADLSWQDLYRLMSFDPFVRDYLTRNRFRFGCGTLRITLTSSPPTSRRGVTILKIVYHLDISPASFVRDF